MLDDRAKFQTEPTIRRQQRVTGHLRTHLAITQDEVRQHGEHRFAPRTLDAPDGETTQADARIMGVTRQAPAAPTGHLMLELKAKGEEKGEDELDKRSAVVKELNV